MPIQLQSFSLWDVPQSGPRPYQHNALQFHWQRPSSGPPLTTPSFRYRVTPLLLSTMKYGRKRFKNVQRVRCATVGPSLQQVRYCD